MGLTNNSYQEETKPLKGYETSIYVSPTPIPTTGYQQISIEPVSPDTLFSTFQGFQNQLPHPLSGVLTRDEFSDCINKINEPFLKNKNLLKIFRILFIVMFSLVFVGIAISIVSSLTIKSQNFFIAPIIFGVLVGFSFFVVIVTIVIVSVKINGKIRDNIFEINSRLSSRGISFTFINRRSRYVRQNINGIHSTYRSPRYSLFVQYPAIVTPVSIVAPVQYQQQYQQQQQQYQQQPQYQQPLYQQPFYQSSQQQPQQLQEQPQQQSLQQPSNNAILNNQPNLNYSIDKDEISQNQINQLNK